MWTYSFIGLITCGLLMSSIACYEDPAEMQLSADAMSSSANPFGLFRSMSSASIQKSGGAKVILSLETPLNPNDAYFGNMNLFLKFSRTFRSTTFVFDPFCCMLNKDEKHEAKWIFVSDVRQEVICKRANSSLTFPKDDIYGEMMRFLSNVAFFKRSCPITTIVEKSDNASTVFVLNNLLSEDIDDDKMKVVLSMGSTTSRNSNNLGFVSNLRLFLKFVTEFNEVAYIFDPLNTNHSMESSLGKWIFSGKNTEKIVVHVPTTYENDDTSSRRHGWTITQRYLHRHTYLPPKDKIYEAFMTMLDKESACKRYSPTYLDNASFSTSSEPLE